ncbi:MAG: DUF6443 domain-containing protein [Bacteroidota bacterium]
MKRQNKNRQYHIYKAWLWATSLSLLFPFLALAQDPQPEPPQSHVRTYSAFEAIQDKTVLTNPATAVDQVQTTTTYIDGLGRQVQIVVKQGSPGLQDVVSHFEYDRYGRATRQYMPFVSGNDGAYKTSAGTLQSDFYTANGPADVATSLYPYAVTIFEPSPLNRPVKQGAPGQDWQPNPSLSVTNDRVVRYDYRFNTIDDQVWWADYDHVSKQVAINGKYAPGMLTKTLTYDEHSRAVIEYTDKQGQVVLKRVQAVDNPSTNYLSDHWANTYYCYDDFGNLVLVLPPEAVMAIGPVTSFPASISNTTLDRWAFQYLYDKRQRLVEKKVPGAEPAFMVYDQRNRLVLTQDGNQRQNNGWTFTKYDVYNRPIATGEYTDNNNTSRQAMHNLVHTYYANVHLNGRAWYENRDNAGKHGYSDNSFPKAVLEEAYLSVTYYDHYDLPLEFSSAYNFQSVFGNTRLTTINGQVTATKTKVLDSHTFLKTVSYYDDRYRLIQSVMDNADGKVDRLDNRYDFAGRLLESRLTHRYGTATHEVVRTYQYDHTGRPVKGWHEIIANGVSQGQVLLAENRYNALGEMVEKNLHVENGTPHQSVDYRYNIRGWLKTINSMQVSADQQANPENDLFGMELFYNSPLNGIQNP